MLLNKERYSTTGVTLRKRGVVVHTAESGDGAYGVLLSLLQRPGDKPVDPKNPNGRKIGAGYHAITTGLGGFTIVADASAGPYAAPPRNKDMWHVCMPGRANQTPEEWLDPLSRGHIRGVAAFIGATADVDGFPLDKLHWTELLAGDSGYCSHHDVSLAWGDTDHTDPGANFPWPILAADIQALGTTPPPEDDMKIMIMQPQGSNAVFLAEATAGEIALNVRWSGKGTQKVLDVLAAHLQQGAIAKISPELAVTLRYSGPLRPRPPVADLANCFLLGPLPTDDVVTWERADFAGVDD